MKLQTMFDKVTKHLLTQKEKCSLDDENGTCLYRGPNGLRCAIGCLIPDKLYSKRLEKKTVWVIAEYKRFKPLFPTQQHVDLATNLQDIHDGAQPSDWEELLEMTASECGLKFNPPRKKK